MLEAVLFSAAFFLLFAAAFNDLRTREVPDWLNIAGIITGIGLRVLWAGTTGDWQVLLSGITGFALFFALGCIMFYAGQWGGGDTKLLMALGALLGLSEYLAAFAIWLLLAGAAYGLVWSIVLAFRNWSGFVAGFSRLSGSLRQLHWVVWSVFVFCAAFAVAAADNVLHTVFLAAALSAPVLFYTLIGVKAVELCCMLKKRSPKELAEGDWIAKPVLVRGRYICGPKDLGIKREQIALLKRLRVKSVIVRDGMPFVPVFLAAFLLMLLFGNLLALMF